MIMVIVIYKRVEEQTFFTILGAGAMTHGSQQMLHMQPPTSPPATTDNPYRPARRPSPIGGSVEEDDPWEIPRDNVRLNKKLGRVNIDISLLISIFICYGNSYKLHL